MSAISRHVKTNNLERNTLNERMMLPRLWVILSQTLNKGAQVQCTRAQIHNARLQMSAKHTCAKKQSARKRAIQMSNDEIN